MRIDEKEQEIRKDRMLHAAYDLFCKNGVDDVTMERIAKEAKVSASSVYRYYENKTSLLEQTHAMLLLEIVGHIADENREQRAQAKNGYQELRILLYAFENLYTSYSNYILFEFEYNAYVLRHHIKLPGGYFTQVSDRMSQEFIHAFQRGLADGSVATEYPLPLLFQMIWGTMRYYVDQLVIHDRMYAGENPWKVIFPQAVEKILSDLKSGSAEE